MFWRFGSKSSYHLLLGFCVPMTKSRKPPQRNKDSYFIFSTFTFRPESVDLISCNCQKHTRLLFFASYYLKKKTNLPGNCLIGCIRELIVNRNSKSSIAIQIPYTVKCDVWYSLHSAKSVGLTKKPIYSWLIMKLDSNYYYLRRLYFKNVVHSTSFCKFYMFGRVELR